MSEIDKALKEAVHQIAAARVAETLGGSDGVIKQMVNAVMDHREKQYGSYAADATTYLDQLVNDALRNEVRDAVRDALALRKAEIRDAISTKVSERVDILSTTIIDAFVTDDWRAELKVEVKKD